MREKRASLYGIARLLDCSNSSSNRAIEAQKSNKINNIDRSIVLLRKTSLMGMPCLSFAKATEMDSWVKWGFGDASIRKQAPSYNFSSLVRTVSGKVKTNRKTKGLTQESTRTLLTRTLFENKNKAQIYP